jgi:phosphoribosylformylglycinamidine cyclo-ligase
VAEELLEPTEIYVRAALDLLRSGAQVRGLAHITGDGLLNLTRLKDTVGYRIDEPLPSQPIFGLIQERGAIPDHEMWEVFNMGTGFCCVVAPGDTERALEVLRGQHAGARPIGEVTPEAGIVEVPRAGLIGDRSGFRKV